MDADDDGDEEYEEIAGEIEVEEDDDDEEMSGSSDYYKMKDVSHGMESKGLEEHSVSDTYGPVDGSTAKSKISTASKATDEPCVDVDENKSLKLGKHLAASDELEPADDKKDPVASVERGALSSKGAHNVKGSFHQGFETAESTESLSNIVFGKEAAAAVSTKDGFTEEASGVVDVKEDIKIVQEQSGKDINEGLTSSSLPQIRPRSLPPIPELNDMNKRPAVICNYFAKGWCIKGSSCKFLHVKDHASIPSQKPEGDQGKIRVQSDFGLRESTERSEANGIPIATSSPSSVERSQSRELVESEKLKASHETLPRQREDSSHGISPYSRSISSFRDFGVDNMKLNSLEDNSINRNGCRPDTLSTLSLSTPTSGILPSFSSSTWTAASYSNSSFNKDPVHAIRSTSWLRSSSPFSGSESKYHSLKGFPMDPLPVAGHSTKIPSDDWEPSVPFRPSFPYTQNLLSLLTLYDPIRDGIEPPKIGNGMSKFPLRPETTITHTHQTMDDDPALPNTIQPEFGSDKHSISGHHKPFDLSEKGGETAGISEDEQNSKSNLPKEEKPSRHVLGKDIAESKKRIHDSIPRLPKSGRSLKKELEMGRDRHQSELNLDMGRDGEQRELKAMKHFRVALIDFVKELVKPTWLEGRLSKDAHKMIVKKAVEKVLSTVQPHQTPSTDESIRHYLSISEPKMAKLVEGYVVKYGKF